MWRRHSPKLDFFVVQDIFLSTTCRFADVVLPACPSLEKEGTFTSTERRIQRLLSSVRAHSWQPARLADHSGIANRLNANWNYAHPSEIMSEMASLAPLLEGVNYERLEGYKSLQWPVAADGSDQPLLYTKKFNFPDGKARLFPLSWSGPVEKSNTEFDLHLNNGRLLEHFHEGNLTYRVNGIREKTPDTFVEISPELAKERGVQSGTWLLLISRYGQGSRARIGHRSCQRTGALYADEFTESPVNRLTSSNTDPVTHTPAFKETSVQMEILPRSAKVHCRA